MLFQFFDIREWVYNIFYLSKVKFDIHLRTLIYSDVYDWIIECWKIGYCCVIATIYICGWLPLNVIISLSRLTETNTLIPYNDNMLSLVNFGYFLLCLPITNLGPEIEFAVKGTIESCCGSVFTIITMTTYR